MTNSTLTPKNTMVKNWKRSSIITSLLGMSTASRTSTSIFVFGLYLALLGVVFLLIPNMLLDLVVLPNTEEVWIHLVGFLLLVLSFYYLMAARTNTREFFRWTIYTRLSAIFFLLAFVLSGLMEPIGLLFWLGDLAGASWTWFALRTDNRQVAAQATTDQIRT